jgi:hypothetical protein
LSFLNKCYVLAMRKPASHQYRPPIFLISKSSKGQYDLV